MSDRPPVLLSAAGSVRRPSSFPTGSWERPAVVKKSREGVCNANRHRSQPGPGPGLGPRPGPGPRCRRASHTPEEPHRSASWDCSLPSTQPEAKDRVQVQVQVQVAAKESEYRPIAPSRYFHTLSVHRSQSPGRDRQIPQEPARNAGRRPTVSCELRAAS